MAEQPRLMFLNLPVRDVAATRAFFTQIGFTFDERFCDESALCLVVSDQAFVMFLAEARFAGFTPRPIADASVTEALVGISADSREAVDELVDAALAAGADKANEPMDHGFMYGRSFLDPDGHLWEVMWMSPEAVEQGPAEASHSG